MDDGTVLDGWLLALDDGGWLDTDLLRRRLSGDRKGRTSGVRRVRPAVVVRSQLAASIVRRSPPSPRDGSSRRRPVRRLPRAARRRHAPGRGPRAIRDRGHLGAAAGRAASWRPGRRGMASPADPPRRRRGAAASRAHPAPSADGLRLPGRYRPASSSSACSSFVRRSASRPARPARASARRGRTAAATGSSPAASSSSTTCRSPSSSPGARDGRAVEAQRPDRPALEGHSPLGPVLQQAEPLDERLAGGHVDQSLSRLARGPVGGIERRGRGALDLGTPMQPGDVGVGVGHRRAPSARRGTLPHGREDGMPTARRRAGHRGCRGRRRSRRRWSAARARPGRASTRPPARPAEPRRRRGTWPRPQPP